MNVYDFDNTIYDGETVVDFYRFCLRKNPSLLKYLPLTFVMLIRYKLGRISLAELEKKAVKYAKGLIPHMPNLSETVKSFWDRHEGKIKSFYLNQKRPDDIIISASFGFILDEIFHRCGIKNYLCSEVDSKTGEILQICFRSNKPEIFKKHFPNAHIDNFYTDSMNDLPMIKLADRAYLVKGGKILEIRKEDIK